jgi:hypothetical protein
MIERTQVGIEPYLLNCTTVTMLRRLGTPDRGRAWLVTFQDKWRLFMQAIDTRRTPLSAIPTANSGVPPELDWLANITNPKASSAYKNDVGEFSGFTGLRQSLRSIAEKSSRAVQVTRESKSTRRALPPATVAGPRIGLRAFLCSGDVQSSPAAMIQVRCSPG